jgi:diguanylate cyclase (GGDEF)-like protein/PAS domain S-box-containing protein
VAVVLDITARRAPGATDRLPPGGHFEEVFERAPLGTGLLDREGRWLLVNRALCDITGYTPEELIGRRFEAIVHPEDAENDLQQRRELLLGKIPAFQVEKRYFDAAGETVSAIVSSSLVRDQAGEPLHYIVQLQDISERKQLEEHLRHLADHDHLTGLRNRRLFDHDLKLQVARSQRYGEMAGLVIIDLDNFKAVNDSHGHAAGDDVLRAVARALTRRLRESDLVSRLGSDEFAVMLPHVDDTSLAFVADGLERLDPTCAVDVGSTVLHPSASVGCTLIATDTVSAEEALVHRPRDVRRQALGEVVLGGPPGPAPPAKAALSPWMAAPDQGGGPLRQGQYAQHMQPDERLSVIDLGSNSFRLVVFQARSEGWRRTDEIYEPVRIGEGLAASGELGEGPMGRALATLDVFAHFAARAGWTNSTWMPSPPARSVTPPTRGFPVRAHERFPPRSGCSPRAGGLLRLPRGGQLDDPDRGLRARPRGGSLQLLRVSERLPASPAPGGGDGADERALPAHQRTSQAQAAPGAP